MSEKQAENSVREIGLPELVQLIWKKLWIVMLTAVLFAGAAFGGTYFLVTPQYEASVKMYVNNSSIQVGSTRLSISNSELAAAQSLVDTYIVILNTRATMNEVIRESGCGYTYEELAGKVRAAAINNTEIFEIIVEDPSPETAEKIADTIADVLPDKISDTVDGSSVRVVDRAVRPAEISSPDYETNTVIGALLGMFLSVVVVVLRKMYDKIIRSEDDLSQIYHLPVLAVIPDMSEPARSGYGGSCGSRPHVVRKEGK